MKITIVGGGAHRVLGILRSALALPGVLDQGEVHLYDLDVARAEAMGRMLLKTPEHRRSGCQIKWSAQLEDALDGANVVGVILPASRARSFRLGHKPSLERGFISSDNISPNGAVSAVKIAPVLLSIVRGMERCCPQAWLINFVNPVAVLSGMINNHSKIRALGVCQGFTNHLWDISRIFGRDEQARSLTVEAAGVNHLSYILNGQWEDEELFTALERRLTADWQMCDLDPRWNEATRADIRSSVGKIVRVWRELGVLIFSTEGDGMAHLMIDESVESGRRAHVGFSSDALDAQLQRNAESRERANQKFRDTLSEDLDTAFWESQNKTASIYSRQDEDIFVRIFAALAGVREARIVTSRLNHGAIQGIKDRQVVEYSQLLFKDTIRPGAAAPCDIPDAVHGLSAALSAHQTLLGDALATEDPKLLARALVSYPVHSFTRASRLLFKELFAIAGSEIAAPYARASEYL